jgi:hypothetical protein
MRNVGFCCGIVKSKAAPFLRFVQKKCGTHASSIVPNENAGPARKIGCTRAEARCRAKVPGATFRPNA